MAKPSKRHHTVPRFYLERFAKDSQLVVTRLGDEVTKTFTENVNDASVRKNFYTLDGPNLRGDEFEEQLSKEESKAARIIARIDDEEYWPLNNEDRAVLACFLAIQHLRGYRERLQLGQIGSAIDRCIEEADSDHTRIMELALHMGIPLEESEAVAISKDYVPGRRYGENRVSSADYHALFINAILLETADDLASRVWTLICFEKRKLITSDNPISALPDFRVTDDRIGTETAGSIVFPLSRSKAVVLSLLDPKKDSREHAEQLLEGRFDQKLSGTTNRERVINASTALNVGTAVYCHPNDTSFIPDEFLAIAGDGVLSADEIRKLILKL